MPPLRTTSSAIPQLGDVPSTPTRTRQPQRRPARHASITSLAWEPHRLFPSTPRMLTPGTQAENCAFVTGTTTHPPRRPPRRVIPTALRRLRHDASRLVTRCLQFNRSSSRPDLRNEESACPDGTPHGIRGVVPDAEQRRCAYHTSPAIPLRPRSRLTSTRLRSRLPSDWAIDTPRPSFNGTSTPTLGIFDRFNDRHVSSSAAPRHQLAGQSIFSPHTLRVPRPAAKRPLFRLHVLATRRCHDVNRNATVTNASTAKRLRFPEHEFDGAGRCRAWRLSRRLIAIGLPHAGSVRSLFPRPLQPFGVGGSPNRLAGTGSRADL